VATLEGERELTGSPSLEIEVRLVPHLGVPELLIILVIFVLVFGVAKLPQIGGALGQGIREFREGTQGVGEEDAREGSSSEGAEA